MKYFHPLLIVVLLVCSLSLWGCTQQKTGAISAKIRELESRYAKMEEDYRVLQTTHEQYRKRLSQAEAQRAALEKDKANLNQQLESSATDREELRKQITVRTTERDAAQTNLMQFGKELQALAGRVESASNRATHSPSVNAVPASRRTQ